MLTKPAFVAICLLGLCSVALGHIEMIQPPPRHSRYNPTFKGDPDWNMNFPLSADRFPFPCRGYEQGGVVQTVKAGDSIDVNLSGGAKHSGGHCQFSLSFDNAKTFVSIMDVMDDCVIAAMSYRIKIPTSAPSSKNVLFAWSWVNKVGNREYYMNCADIEIQGTIGGSITGPQMLVVNYPGYPTIPEFPHPGQDTGKKLFDDRPIITIRP
ncbi:hypothetical protein K7432_011316 [Basidiobolus ranarum]|uniref:Endoglucanase n=1 Tax=Basidiobolus ranarum TaxID=34480 RepID=A0ABR2WMF9_9FUNG